MRTPRKIRTRQPSADITRLEIQVRQPFADGSIETAAVARVRRLTDAKGEPVKRWWEKEKPVGIGGRDSLGEEFTEFELPGGGYYRVTIILPRGDGVDREFDIRGGDVRRELIEMEVSPHEYLSWQQYAGIVRAKPNMPQVSVRIIGSEPNLWEMGMRRMAFLRGKSIDERPSVSGVSLLGSESDWKLIGENLPGFDHWIRDLDWPVRSDPDYVTWDPEMPTHDESAYLVAELRHYHQHPFWSSRFIRRYPRWVIFEIAGQRTLASVPWAWCGHHPRDGAESIRFVYDRTRQGPLGGDQAGHLTLSVQDRQWFGLLEFLGSGRLYQANGMIEEVVDVENRKLALYGKIRRPLVAVVGGIISISRCRTIDKQEWDSWLDNLANWFPGVPDGPILLGCRRAMQAENLEQLQAAFGHITSGVDRGIPFFSASIAMMNRSLAEMSDAIPEAGELRRFIAPVAARIDPGQPFTVIRLS